MILLHRVADPGVKTPTSTTVDRDPAEQCVSRCSRWQEERNNNMDNSSNQAASIVDV